MIWPFKKNVNQMPLWYQTYYKNIVRQQVHPSRLVVLDIETSGMDAAKHQITSIAALAIEENQIYIENSILLIIDTTFNANVQAESLAIQPLHDAKSERVSLEIALATLLQFIGNSTLIGYYLHFDCGFINQALKGMGASSLKNAQCDILQIAIKKQGYQLGDDTIKKADFTLNKLAQRYQLPFWGIHNPMLDVWHTACLYLMLTGK